MQEMRKMLVMSALYVFGMLPMVVWSEGDGCSAGFAVVLSAEGVGEGLVSGVGGGVWSVVAVVCGSSFFSLEVDGVGSFSWVSWFTVSWFTG